MCGIVGYLGKKKNSKKKAKKLQDLTENSLKTRVF